MTILISFISALLSGGIFYLTGLYTAWYWYFIPVLLFFPLYVVSFVLLVLVFAFIGLFFSKKKEVKKPVRFFYWVTVNAIRQVLMLLRVKVQVTGLEKLPEGEFVAVYNHISFFDPLVLMVKMPVKRIVMISKPENEKIPVVGKYMHMSGYLVIDRKSPLKAKKTTDKCVNWIKEHIASVAISPEGTRSKTGKLLPFRAAPFSVAKKAECPIAVVALKNTDKVFKCFPFRRTLVSLDVVDVVEPEVFQGMNSFEMSDCIREKMLAGLGLTEEKAEKAVSPDSEAPNGETPPSDEA